MNMNLLTTKEVNWNLARKCMMIISLTEVETFTVNLSVEKRDKPFK